MEIGKLYQVKQYFWLLYPSKDIAVAVTADAEAVAGVTVVIAAGYADYWSREFNCNVSFVPQNSIFMLLEQDGKYYKVLSTEGMVGWIYFSEWCKEHIEHIAEVKAE
jgi:hypothetical protein